MGWIGGAGRGGRGWAQPNPNQQNYFLLKPTFFYFSEFFINFLFIRFGKNASFQNFKYNF